MVKRIGCLLVTLLLGCNVLPDPIPSPSGTGGESGGWPKDANSRADSGARSADGGEISSGGDLGLEGGDATDGHSDGSVPGLTDGMGEGILEAGPPQEAGLQEAGPLEAGPLEASASDALEQEAGSFDEQGVR